MKVGSNRLDGEAHARSYLYVFTDGDLARAFVESAAEPGLQVAAVSLRTEFGNILKACQAAGVSRVAIDPTFEQTTRPLQYREIDALIDELAPMESWDFPCYLMESSPAGSIALIQATPSNYIGVFSSEEKCRAYMKARNQVPNVRKIASPKELADLLRQVPDRVANACLFDPVAESNTRRACKMRTDVVRDLDQYDEGG